MRGTTGAGEQGAVCERTTAAIIGTVLAFLLVIDLDYWRSQRESGVSQQEMVPTRDVCWLHSFALWIAFAALSPG